MIQPLTVLKIISLFGWAWIVVRTFHPAIRSFTKAIQPHDPFFAIMCGLAVNRIQFVGGAVFAGTNPNVPIAEMLWSIAAYLVAITLQVVILRFAAWSRGNVT